MSLISQAQEYRATLALLLLGTAGGYFAGRLSASKTPEFKSTSPSASEPKEVSPAKEKEETVEKGKNTAQTATDSDWEEEDQGEFAEFSGIDEECKLVLVVRTDLGMTKGTSTTSSYRS